MKENFPEVTPSIRLLCPTRWTIRAESLASVLANYNTLQHTWEEAVEVTQDTEANARILGVLAQMSMFPYLYGTMLAEMILKHADNLSRTLQHKSMSAGEGQQVAAMTASTLKSVQNDESFDLFWEKSIVQPHL